MSLEQTEDLKAFERRLTEVIAAVQPATGRWRLVLVITTILTAAGAWNWIRDPLTMQSSLIQSLFDHWIFTLSITVLIILFLTGIHKRVVAPAIIASRCRLVLEDYNMACDDTGKLILKPRPTT